MREMVRTDADHVWLDVRHLTNFAERFPTINASCLAHGINPANDLIPVAPASHYASGGVRVDLAGRTSIAGLYACGETACSGVHGANRLASNSLLEGLVFGSRIASDIASQMPTPGEPITDTSPTILIEPSTRKKIQKAMSIGAGVLRSANSLEITEGKLTEINAITSKEPCVEAWETTNLLQLSQGIVRSAQLREETRGSHWREDFPVSVESWRKRIIQSINATGKWSVRTKEVVQV